MYETVPPTRVATTLTATCFQSEIEKSLRRSHCVSFFVKTRAHRMQRLRTSFQREFRRNFIYLVWVCWSLVRRH